MTDPTAPIPSTRPDRHLPMRTLLLVMVCWGGTFAFLDSWVECRTLPGLDVPETASLVGALGVGGMLIAVLVFLQDLSNGPGSSDAGGRARRASPVDEPPANAGPARRLRQRVSSFAMLIVLVVLAWHGAMGEYDTALSRIETGECDGQGRP